MSRDRVSQDVIEVLTVYALADVHAVDTQYVVETLQAYTAGTTPAGLFGVAASSRLTEVLIAAVIGARIQTYEVEVLFADGVEGGGSGGIHSFGYAV